MVGKVDNSCTPTVTLYRCFCLQYDYSCIRFDCILFMCFCDLNLSCIYDRLRSASGLKSASITQINIHRHRLITWSDLKIFLNRFPFQILRSIANFLVRVRAYISDVIGRQFEKVRDGHRLENWMPKKGHRSEVQMSVMQKSNMDLRIGRQSESHICFFYYIIFYSLNSVSVGFI